MYIKFEIRYQQREQQNDCVEIKKKEEEEKNENKNHFE